VRRFFVLTTLLNRRTAKLILFVKLTKHELRWFNTGQINWFFYFLLLSCIIYNNYNFNSLNVQWLIVTSLQQSSFADTSWALTEEISLSPANFNSILNTVADYFSEIFFFVSRCLTDFSRPLSDCEQVLEQIAENVQWLIVTSLQQSFFADTSWALTEEISLSPANFNSILNTVSRCLTDFSRPLSDCEQVLEQIAEKMQIVGCQFSSII